MKNPYKLYLRKYTAHYHILRNIDKDKSVLDVGCNDGYLGTIADKSNVFYGLDYSKESIKKAKKIYKDALVYDLNNLNNLPWTKKFDIIIFADVLEHLLDAEHTLNFFVKNYLTRNGKVIISLPNIANWKIRLQLLLGKFNYTEVGILDKTHLHFYTFETAHQLIHNSNLKVDNQFGTSKLFGPILNYFPFLNSILGINIILVCSRK